VSALLRIGALRAYGLWRMHMACDMWLFLPTLAMQVDFALDRATSATELCVGSLFNPGQALTSQASLKGVQTRAAVLNASRGHC